MSTTQSRRLVGGSAGMSKGNFTHPFVQSGVKLFEPGENQVSRVRLLPAFEKDMNGFPTGLDTFIPYRKPREDGETDGQFNDWFVEVLGYRFLGPNKLKFLSPTTGSEQPAAGTDPLVDLFRAARASKDESISWFVDKDVKKSKEDRMHSLQWPSRMYLMNILLLNDENQLENQILKLSGKGMEAITIQLNNPSTKGSPAHPGYEEYLFGDAIAPDSGLWGQVKPHKFGDANMSTSSVFFGRKLNDWDNVEAFPFDPLSEDGQIFLRGRYDLCDTDKVIRFPTKEEMVAGIFGGLPWLPYDWAAGVLQDLGYEVPKNQHRATMVSQPAQAAPQPARPAAPQRPVAPTAPAARSVAPAAAARPAAPAAPVTSAPRPQAAAPVAAPRPAAAARPTATTTAPTAAPRPAAAPAAARQAPRPTVATVAPVPTTGTEPEGDGQELADAGLAPAAEAAAPQELTPEIEAELTALEESLQNDPANFGPVAMQRMSDLVALRDAAALSA